MNRWQDYLSRREMESELQRIRSNLDNLDSAVKRSVEFHFAKVSLRLLERLHGVKAKIRELIHQIEIRKGSK